LEGAKKLFRVRAFISRAVYGDYNLVFVHYFLFIFLTCCRSAIIRYDSKENLPASTSLSGGISAIWIRDGLVASVPLHIPPFP
jgi:hypothetical protein